MRRASVYLIFVISCILYFFAPNTYSFEYCLCIHNLFLVSAVFLYIIDVKNEKVGFNVLFTLSFFFTNFVYPVYIYPIDPSYSLFQFPFNEKVITRCTALAQVGYAAYMCGYVQKWQRMCNTFSISEVAITNIKLRNVEAFVCMFVCLFCFSGGLEYFEDRYLRGDMSSNMVVQYMMLFFTPIVVWFASLILLCKNRHQSYQIYIILACISFILMMSGTRTIPLVIFASLFIIYCYQHKVSAYFVILWVIVGVVLMSFIGNVRQEGVLASASGSGYDVSSQFGWLEHFSDLFICNRGLYVFYDYVDTHSYTYGLSMLGCLLSPIPFGQRLFMNVTGIPSFLLDSPNFHTFLQFGAKPPLGLGTNIVGDVYLAFGLIGVVVLFFILGRFIVYVRGRMYNGSYLYTIVYLVVASDAIYMCRAAYFDAFKSVLWTILIAWIFIGKHNKKHNI